MCAADQATLYLYADSEWSCLNLNVKTLSFIYLTTHYNDGAVVMSSANGLVGTGSYLGTGSNPERVFKGPVGRCMATTPSSFSLTSNRVTTKY